MDNRITLIFFLLCMLTWRCLGVDEIMQLPADENDAAVMFAEGMLDSLLWERIAPFYAEPIPVPGGELARLRELFPEREIELPAHPDSLDRYKPWSNRDIRRFFSDYPHLARYAHLLSFDDYRVSSWGIIGLRGRYRGDFDSSQRQYLWANLRPHRTLGVQARMAFDDNDVHWGRRMLSVKNSAVGEIRVGNYVLSENDGFVYGYFPSTVNDSLSAGRRFLYGQSLAFNGIQWRRGIGKRTRMQVFYHERNTERAAGTYSSIRLSRTLTVSAGISALQTDPDEKRDILYAGHYGLAYHGKPWVFSLKSCTVYGTRLSVPFSVSAGHRGDGARIDIEYTFLPSGFESPRSALYKTVLDKLQTDTLAGPSSLLVCSLKRTLGTWLLWSPSILYAADDVFSACEASMVLVMLRGVDLRIRYAYRAALFPAAGAGERHTLSAQLNHDFSASFGVECQARAYIRTHDYWSLRARIYSVMRLHEGVEFAPFAVAGATVSGNYTLNAGIRHSLRLFEKTYGVLACEVPCIHYEKERVTLDARIQFLL